MMNDFWTASGDTSCELTPPPPHTHYPCSLSPLPIIRLDKMETYAEILVTVGITALLRPSLSSKC